VRKAAAGLRGRSPVIYELNLQSECPKRLACVWANKPFFSCGFSRRFFVLGRRVALASLLTLLANRFALFSPFS